MSKAALVLALTLPAFTLLAGGGPAHVTEVRVDASGAAVADGATARHASDRVLVKFRRGRAHDVLAGSRAVRRYEGDADLALVENPAGVSVEEALRRYRGNANVLYAEPDFTVSTLDVFPSDPLFSQQWDMSKIAAPAAWASQTDAGDVVVAVIDTGIAFSHPDLAANVWTNPADGTHGFTAKNGILTTGGLDDNGHGTHCAGTIGAAANNGAGIAGLNWRVKLLAMKFLDANGSGSVSDAILLLDKAVSLKGSGVNIRVASNSWGGGGYSQALKDAFSRAESAGILSVCAAGNSGQNADLSPMYPAAYDNRGIVSVLATDASDATGWFSNFGLASTDLSAPGVSTLSTVPTGSCALCDPSGYRTLSGTSMATPHVSGVAAALFHVNPALTAAQARDVVLDRASTDALTDAHALLSTTGARLNFAKALANPLLVSPKLNGFPTISAGSGVSVAAGGAVTLQATASDPDGDALRTSWAKSRAADTAWLMGAAVDAAFPQPSGNPVSFTAPRLALPASVTYVASTADGRGGSASAAAPVTVAASASPGGAPAGTLTVTPSSVATGSTVTVSFPATDPEGRSVTWDLLMNGRGSSSGACCFTGSSTSLTMSAAGVYRFRAQAVDPELNLSASSTVVVSVGGATGVPPIASARQDVKSGPVPLTVNWDLSGSYDPDGSLVAYFVDCDATGNLTQTTSTSGACTFANPGVHLVRLYVVDNAGIWDSAYLYASATAGTSPAPPDSTPSVAITAPSSGASVSGVVSVTASASDVADTIARVDFYRDSGVFLGSSTTAPYAASWDTSSVPGGSHSLYAKAYDAAGISATSASVSVNVQAPAPSDTTAPTVSITSPANGATVARRSSVTISASASDNVGVTRVDVLVNGSLVCSDAASPYACAWNVPAKSGATYRLQAKAYDAAGNAGSSSLVTVTAR